MLRPTRFQVQVDLGLIHPQVGRHPLVHHVEDVRAQGSELLISSSNTQLNQVPKKKKKKKKLLRPSLR